MALIDARSKTEIDFLKVEQSVDAGNHCSTSAHTILTCPSSSSASSSSLAFQQTSSDDPPPVRNHEAIEKYVNDSLVSGTNTTAASSINTPRDLTMKRKKWIEETLLNNPYHSYSSSARDECCKQQNSSDLAYERRRWVEETLLDNKSKSYSTSARDEICKLINGSKDQAMPSVAQRCQWLSEWGHVKSAAELEGEVRQEAMKASQIKEEARTGGMRDKTAEGEADGHDGEKGISAQANVTSYEELAIGYQMHERKKDDNKCLVSVELDKEAIECDEHNGATNLMEKTTDKVTEQLTRSSCDPMIKEVDKYCKERKKKHFLKVFFRRFNSKIK
ncbi:hypothetical protein ACHAWF_016259 [Thalassiosira exigua]